MAQEEEYSSGSDSGSDKGTPPPPPKIPQSIQNWWLNENLGSGYSGSIFKATNLHTHQVVALKVQYVHHECPTNKYERHFYPLLQGGVGMPRLYAAGVYAEWDYLAIDLLGSSLDSLFRKSGKDTMDLRSVCSIAVQVIQRLQFMHTRGVLHRDIQLGNCTIGLPPHEKTIYMIDFGFSKRYIDQYTNRHIPDSKVKRDFIGNYWFSSVNVHCRGKVPSRRDDLEALALMLIHLLTPRGLSWTRNGVPKTSEAHDRLKAEKRNATAASLCRGLPIEFEEFLSYTRRLKFMDCPDYDTWVDNFRDLAEDSGYASVDEFIWPPPIPVTPVTKTSNTPLRARTPALPRDEMAGILNDLTRLNLDAQPVLGDRTNVQAAVRQAQQDVKIDSTQQSSRQAGAGPAVNVLIISSGSEGENLAPLRYQVPKAQRLVQLADKASNAVDNATLGKLVREFVQVLQMNSSRTLTKDAVFFLDVLYKQLDDPSVFIKPQRPSRQQSFAEQTPEKQPAHVKLGVVARLRREVSYCPSNKALATMVSDFTKVTNKSTGRTVTKDGFTFFEGLADRLASLQ
ncbi:CK1/CK1 protein kinase [Crepidotus variabilis]|uniref:CK1/CK1 protein kinase n=1 Tax=Crepidotus variabilis TaxID=179855 RepID=A0A9P6EEQ0_9AGAR|nr:CK1/CK1 protein kinase [Crepidotus variabilis]